MVQTPAPFEYERATSVEGAVAALKQRGSDARIIAGGHSLLPMMKLRLANPAHLIDINDLDELSFIRVTDGNVEIGALTRHVKIQNSDTLKQNLPILAEVADEVGDNQVRNMGTIGGVVAHADAAGDYPTLALMLEAEIVTNKRRFPAKDFFKDIFTTPLDHDELVCEVVFPVANGPHKYIKFRRRLFDWAIVGAAAQKMDGGWRIGLTNVGPTPVRATAVEQALASGSAVAEAAEHASDGLNPSADLRASADYKKHLARVLTRRAIEQAGS